MEEVSEGTQGTSQMMTESTDTAVEKNMEKSKKLNTSTITVAATSTEVMMTQDTNTPAANQNNGTSNTVTMPEANKQQTQMDRQR